MSTLSKVVERHLESMSPVRELPCDICGEPCHVKNPKAELAAHWACAILGKERVQELKRAHSATSAQEKP